MSESKYSQNGELGDIFLSHVISLILSHKQSNGFFSYLHDLQSWVISIAIQLPKYSDHYLLSQSVIGSQWTGNGIQSKTL